MVTKELFTAQRHSPYVPGLVAPGGATGASCEDWSSPISRQATARQRRHALIVCVAIVLVTAAFFPIAQEQWPRFAAFIPAYQTAVIFDYLVCAYLIFGHYRATGSNALLHLGCGCLYTGLVMIAQFLSFPGMFDSQGLLPGGAQTTIWLWFFWHFGPVTSMLLYAWSEWRRPGYIDPTPGRTTLKAVVALILAVGASIATVTTFHDALPVLDVNGDFSRITSTGVAPFLQVMTLLALVLLWRVSGFRTVLQIWVGVSLVALLCDNAITMIGGTRLSVGWYMGRSNALISASVLLFVYLREINHVYQRTVDHARELAAAKAVLEVEFDQARLDHLTQLPGRALFLELAQAAIARGAAEGRRVAVLYIDLDGFKQVNDTRGHERGDAVLMQTATVLRKSLRQTDIPGRLGGDEFVAFITAPPAAIEATASHVARRIVASVGQIGDGIGCSIGVAIASAESMRLETTMRRADEAMYQAKRQGKNCYRIHGQTSDKAELATSMT